MSRAKELLPSAADAIGNTPLVELSRLTRGTGGRIFAKLEYLNPGFSKKDRIARQILQEAEASGALKPGQPVVELTSGNTGTGAAIMCAVPISETWTMCGPVPMRCAASAAIIVSS